MKILITGISGLLGSNLAWYFRERAEVTGIYYCHPVAFPGVKTSGIDLRDYTEVRKLLENINPDVVIHCASRTDVDGIEEDREGGWQANVLTTRVLLDALRDLPARMVYISTDSVYPGKKGPYTEKDQTGPCNWYGETKLEGERLIQARPDHLILRTNIFGWNVQEKDSLGEWFLKKLQQGKSVGGVTDARFSSIYTFLFASILADCLRSGVSGTFNCASHDSWTKFEFGQRLADRFGFESGKIKPCVLGDLELVAERGCDLSLDVYKLESVLGQSLPTMADSLDHFYWDHQDGAFFDDVTMP